MAVSRLSQHSIQNAFPKGNTVWDGTTATSAFDSLGAVYVSTATSTITFSSIPQTYQHLEIRSLGANSASSNQYVKLVFNSDTGANYAEHHLSGNGTSTPSGANSSLSNGGFYWGMGLPGTSLSNVFGAGVTSILDYSSTSKFKTILSFDGFDANGSGGVELVSNLWRSTSAITSITLTVNEGNNFRPYSQFSLYGIK
jgi:hypothetical protein